MCAQLWYSDRSDEKEAALKPVRYLLGKIRRYDPDMLWVMAANTLLSALYPFIWVLVPAWILRYGAIWDRSTLILVIAGAGALAAGCGFAISFWTGNYRMRMNGVRYHLIRDLMAHSLRMPYQNTLDPQVLDDINFANETVSNPMRGAGGIILTLLRLFGGLLASLGFAGLIATLSPWFMLGMVMLFALTFMLSHRADRIEADSWDEYQGPERRWYQINTVAQDAAYKKDILLYETSPLIIRYMQHFRAQMMDIMEGVSKKRLRLETWVCLLNLLRDIGLFAFIIQRFLAGSLDAGGFFLYSSGLAGFMTVAQAAMTDISAIRREGERFAAYIRLVDGKKAEEAMAKPPVPTGTGALVLENVSFRYPGAPEDTLKNISLSLPPGHKLALVGENGAGKSTLIKLICRLYRPSNGRITLDGVDIWDIPEGDYFSRLGVVFQDAMILPFSLKENVLMGEAWDKARYQQVMALSGLDKIADELPQGDESSLMRVLDDRGVDLSGGQKQSLFLARALYKNAGALLILDEPTAALDSLAERALYERYGAMAQGKSSIFVSHRLASTRFCDTVLFLKDGAILEEGSHEALIARGGEYAALFDIQAKYYREEEGHA